MKASRRIPRSGEKDSRHRSTDLQRGRAAFDSRHWRQAADLLVEADRAHPLAADDLERLAWAYGLSGRNDLLIATLERVHDLQAAAANPLAAARAAFWAGMRLSFMGEMGRGTGWLGRAHRLLEQAAEDCVERGYLLIPRAHALMARKDPVAAGRVAHEAAAIGDRFGDPDLASLARTVEGQACIAAGRRDAGLALLDEAVLPACSGKLGPVVTGIVYCTVVSLCQRVWAIDRAREWCAALTAWCDAQPELVEFSVICRVHRSEILQLEGAWPRAIEEARRAANPLATPMDTAAACYQQAEILRLQGEFAAAEESYRQASRNGREPQPGLALLRLAEGRTDVAAAAIRQAVGAASEPFARARFLPAAVEILLAAGDLDGAEAAARDLQHIADDAGSDVLEAMAAHARGALCLARGEPSEAVEPLRTGFATWQRVGAPYLAARIRVLIAQALAALGDEDGAELERSAAVATFRDLGAVPDLERLTAATATPAPTPFGLTAREIEVLRRVASGRTNREIAESLFLSERTVDRHVSNIFAKLDVPTRAAATAFAYQHKLI